MKIPVCLPVLLSTALWLTGVHATEHNPPAHSPVKPQGAATITPDRDWSAWQKESASDLKCGEGKVLIGREHQGDENADSRILCATVIQFEPLKKFNETLGESLPSNNFDFTCPSPKVVTGRSSEGDENGTTQFQCAEFRDAWGDALRPIKTRTIEGKESSHQLTCDENEVVIGSGHSGDENGVTTYHCAKLF
ncbi:MULTISPECIES: hypothetical protein [unclassified Pseudomonas]|uniref:hypothetical protein n=1 Tax=unclassified Pseudomonas TaxID=196821 RepID=UPI0035C255A2